MYVCLSSSYSDLYYSACALMIQSCLYMHNRFNVNKCPHHTLPFLFHVNVINVACTLNPWSLSCAHQCVCALRLSKCTCRVQWESVQLGTLKYKSLPPSIYLGRGIFGYVREFWGMSNSNHDVQVVFTFWLSHEIREEVVVYLRIMGFICKAKFELNLTSITEKWLLLCDC